MSAFTKRILRSPLSSKLSEFTPLKSLIVIWTIRRWYPLSSFSMMSGSPLSKTRLANFFAKRFNPSSLFYYHDDLHVFGLYLCPRESLAHDDASLFATINMQHMPTYPSLDEYSVINFSMLLSVEPR